MGYNSTIINKKKNLGCGHFDYNFSKNRCKSCATIESTQRRIDKFEEIEQDENLQSLVEDADVWFSKFIRLYYANEKGQVECYTSGRKYHWTQIQCGHYISRKHFATRWLPENCRPQSEYDNCHLNGNLEVFKEKLEAEDKGIVTWLEEQARQISKPTRDEMKQIIVEYRTRVKLLEKKIIKSPKK